MHFLLLAFFNSGSLIPHTRELRSDGTQRNGKPSDLPFPPSRTFSIPPVHHESLLLAESSSSSGARRRARSSVACVLTRSQIDAARLRLLNLGQNTLLDPQVDERLHRLRVLLTEQVVKPRDVDKVHETGVELAVTVQVPEGEPVLPVKVGVAAEHLLVHVLDLALEALREARWFAEPVVGIGGSLGCGWNGRSRGKRIHGEERRIKDLAADPGLNMFDVGGCRERHRFALLIDPGIILSKQWISMPRG
jgi:hypothetical protein